MKSASLKTLEIKKSLKCCTINNYRLFSNLTFVFKIIERTGTRGQSTETALVRVNNDILMSTNQSKPVLFVPLHLSVPFNIIDHNALFSRLKVKFSLSDKLLECLQTN